MSLLIDIPVPFEPFKKNRFIVRFPSSMGINEWYVDTAQRPKYSLNKIPVHFFNTMNHVIGIATPEPITLTFKEPIGPSATQALQEWFRLHHEPLSGRQGYAAGYKKDIEIILTDPIGAGAQKWILIGCQIENLDYGDLSYSDDGVTNATVTIQMDRWELVY